MLEENDPKFSHYKPGFLLQIESETLKYLDRSPRMST